MKGFQVKAPWDFEDDEEQIGEHKQVREALKDFGEKNMKTELEKLFYMRQKADYDPFIDIEPKEVTDAIHHMEKIFNHLEIK